MLILSGVSLNAIIGDNGIITNAQQASFKTGMASLEEWLQQKYVEFYDDSEKYENKQEVLANNINDLFLTDGSRNYVINEGKVYYLLKKSTLPKEIRDGLSGGNTTDYSKYTRLIDVYGVTDDLKVYYYNSEDGTAYGNVEASNIDLTKVKAGSVNSDSNMKSFIEKILSDKGVEVSEDGITLSNLDELGSLTIDGTTTEGSNITSLSGLQDIKNLRELTLKNMDLPNLNGLQGCPSLYYLYLKNCRITDYTELCSVLKLKYLYIYLPSTMSAEIANNQVTYLGNGLTNASGLTKLTDLIITGNLEYLEPTVDYAYTTNTSSDNWISRNKYRVKLDNKRSNLTDLSGLGSFNPSVKTAVKYLDLYSNNLSSISALSGFTGLVELSIQSNLNLESLSGLENHVDLERLIAHNCNLMSVSGLTGCTSLKYVTLQDNTSLSSLGDTSSQTNKGLASSSIYVLFASNCNIADISALYGKTNLIFLDLDNNVNLINVSTLGSNTSLTQIYLENNTNMDPIQLANALGDEETHILTNCGQNYRIPPDFMKYFGGLSSYNYSYSNLKNRLLLETDEEFLILSGAGKTGIKRLNLSGQTSISDGKLQEVLAGMYNLQYISLNGTNLTSLDFLKGTYNETKKEYDKPLNSIVELDIRNCNFTADTTTGKVDLSLLNSHCGVMRNLIFNDTNIDVSSFQNAINQISSVAGTTTGSWITDTHYNLRGVIFFGNYNWRDCSDIVNFRSKRLNLNGEYSDYNANVDLTNCLNLKLVSVSQCGLVKLAGSLNHLTMDANFIDCSNVTSIKDCYLGNTGLSRTENGKTYNGTIAYFLDHLKLSENGLKKVTKFTNEFSIMRYPYITLENIADLDFSELKTLYLSSASASEPSRLQNLGTGEIIVSWPSIKTLYLFGNPYLNDITNIGIFPNVTEIDLYNDTKTAAQLKSLNGIGACKSLVILYAYSLDLNNISALKPVYDGNDLVSGCPALEHLKLHSNKNLSNIDGVQGLTQLVEFTISDCGVIDLSPLLGCRKTSGRVGFTQLNLLNNNVGATVSETNSNVDTLVALNKAGVKKLNLTGNKFYKGQAARLIEAYGSDLTITYVDDE